MGDKPEYKISVFEKEGVLEIVLTGEATQNNVEKIQEEVISIIISSKASGLLVDVRGIKGRLGYTEAYFRVRNYPSDVPKLPVAIVDLAENADYESFHETTAMNAGLTYKWFTDIDEARAWLKNKL
ncbi:hypothetical protein ASZ90_005527 [hydrocarbon metagenome]|uniref:STAS/SEC14 domain-containing protein n=1 Tax=hydrocarbon metagenome TaxID=938273 RepID=A0A0W8FUT0_9ZZZZ